MASNHILPRIKEAFAYMKDCVDHDPALLDRDMLNHIYVQYDLDKVWRHSHGNPHRTKRNRSDI